MAPESRIRRQDGPIELLESRDVAFLIGGVGTDRVRQLVRSGRLQPAAITPRGVQLFDPASVHELAEQRRAARRGSR